MIVIYVMRNNDHAGKAQLKRRTFHVPNQMQISLNKGFCSLTLDSANEKLDIWTGPNSERVQCNSLTLDVPFITRPNI